MYGPTRTRATWKPRVGEGDLAFFETDDGVLALGLHGARSGRYDGTDRSNVFSPDYLLIDGKETMEFAETAPDAAVTAVNRKRELIKNKIIGRERCIREAFSVIGIGGVNKILEFVRIGNAVISRRRNKCFSLFCVINEERRKLFNCTEILFGA